ncbi:rhodanese-like domain-containing protein [Mesorhizobium sp. SB112]|uniref:rhodanese-like domain-containing protein n=1 Tax=Mesorhizobium sp. SB112 TaxID=3151853 RepID=UPI003263E5DC
MTATLPSIDAKTLHARLRADKELALLDIREEGLFAEDHILAASNVPFSRIERILSALVPRVGTPIVLVDDGEGLAERAAPLFRHAGYVEVSVLSGGVAAWKAAGFETFEGVYVPSKAFGEFVEVSYETPHITAAQLEQKRDAGENVVLIDSRPFDEYNWITIPGAIDLPGGELVLRVKETVKDDSALVVVNCGGRTRSIIGAQTLIDAGLPNKVVSLKDGTQGWHLSGREVERGATRIAPQPTAEALDWARSAAARLSENFGVKTVSTDQLAQFVSEQDSVALYRFDVRDPAEFRAGHLKGFLSAPGGQLVQATDTFIAVRQARIVLTDSDGVRARTAAAWLNRMGFAWVFVLDAQDGDAELETGDAPETILTLDAVSVEEISASELASLVGKNETVVVDFATSRQYRAGHIPGAWFAVRGRLVEDVAALPKAEHYVVTSPDGVFARLGGAELAAATGASVTVLKGGTNGWVQADLALQRNEEFLASEPNDVFLKAFERREKREEAMRQYLQWELDLVEQVRRDGTLSFNL